MRWVGRHRRQLFELLRDGPLSRTELVKRLGIRRNTVYDDVAWLLEHRLVRETDPEAAGVGRPRTPLELDGVSRHVLGVSFQPEWVEVGRFNVLGEPMGEAVARKVSAASAIRAASELVSERQDRGTVAVGVCLPGFVDREHDRVAFSMLFRDTRASLRPIRDAAGALPTVIETEAHAVAARWLLTHARTPREDTLLIYFDDGSLGAAFIVRGRPNRGCISGANELGHTRLRVETARCYCGGVGCLERVCDTADLKTHGLGTTLGDAVARGDLAHPAMRRMIDLLATGFANAVNFTRAAHVVVASQLPGSGGLIDRLIDETRAQLLPQLHERVSFAPWPEADARSAHTAAHLALTSLYFEDW